MKTTLEEFIEAIKQAGIAVTLHPDRQKKPYRCPVCHGAGTVGRNLYSDPGEIGTPLVIPKVRCRTCSGAGVVWG